MTEETKTPKPAVPAISVEKPSLPTLWLDTSVVINLEKIERGKVVQEIAVERGNHLRKLINGLVEEGKLICPQSDQEEEYIVGDFARQVHAVFASLSLGVRLKHRHGIYQEHLFEGMKAHVEHAGKIDLPASTYFHQDPIQHLKERREQKFVISIGPVKIPELLERQAEAKVQIGREWEALRQKLVDERQTYEKQLQLELNGHADAMVELIRRFETNRIHGHPNFWDLSSVEDYFLYRAYWDKLGGKPPGFEGVHKFLCSPHFNELPLPFTGCRLGADLLTGPAEIVPSDSMDVDFLSVALPIAHYVLADKQMEQRIKRLGLDKRWSTKVYSMSSIDSLFAELEKL